MRSWSGPGLRAALLPRNSEGGLEILVLKAGPRRDPAKDFKTHTWPYEMLKSGELPRPDAARLDHPRNGHLPDGHRPQDQYAE